jgi:HAD superfamily hydrolase (TIGR01490 family)
VTVPDSAADHDTSPTPSGPGPRTAAFFDLDKTIIAKSSTLAFSKPFFAQGLINRRAVLKSSYAQFLFLLSGADHDQMDRMRIHLTNMCTGWDAEQIKSIVNETLHDIVTPLVFAEAADLIASHKLCGRDVVVVSASGEELVAPIARALGATHAMATRMVVEDGKYTGEIGFYCYGEGKVQAIRELAARVTRSSIATPTRIRSPTCRCSRSSATRAWSIPTAPCAGKRPPAAGRCWRSPGRCRCATVSRHRRELRSPRPPRSESAHWPPEH